MRACDRQSSLGDLETATLVLRTSNRTVFGRRVVFVARRTAMSACLVLSSLSVRVLRNDASVHLFYFFPVDPASGFETSIPSFYLNVSSQTFALGVPLIHR